MAVALITDAYIPDNGELQWVLERTQSNGWLETMRQDLRDLDISDVPLVNPNPSTVANIRFLPENILLYGPMLPLNPPHKATTTYRYPLLDWDDGFPLPSNATNFSKPDSEDRDDSADRSETDMVRPPQTGTVFEPQHSILQNRLRKVLRARYGASAVRMEKASVDLVFMNEGRVTFIEIKMERTVKNCIRLAIGQLVEYAQM